MYWNIFLIFILSLPLAAQKLLAQEFVVQGKESWPQNLKPYLHYYHQSDTPWDANPKFPELGDFTIPEAQDLKNMHRGTNWIALTIRNQSASLQRLTLTWGDFYYPIEAYERTTEGHLRLLSPEEANNFEIGFFSLHLDLAKEQSRSFWLRFQKDLPRADIPVTLSSRESFELQRNLEIVLRMFFIGCTLTIFFYNLFYLISLGQKQYGLYCLYVFFLGILMASQFSIPTLIGVGERFFSEYRFYIGYTSYELALIACLAYSIEFLDLHRLRPRLTRRLQLYYPLTVASYLFIFVAAPVYESLFVLKLVGLMVYMTFLSISLVRDVSLASKLYASGFTILLIGNFINILATFNVIPVSLFTLWVAPASAVVEMLTLSFALSEKVRSQQMQSQDTIEGLNRNLKETNQKLDHSLQSLQHEVQSRNSMVEDLSHRGNNPLHAANLAIDNIRREILEAEQLLGELFGPEEKLEEEARDCLQSFRINFANIRTDMSLTRNSLYRMADAIKEIRLMGETEGLTSEWVSWNQVLDGVFQRLRENLSEQGLANLHVDRGFMEGIQIHAHPLVLTICLERLFRRLIKSNNQALFVRVSSQQQTADQGIFDFHFSGDNVCWPAELGELGAALTYILRSQGIQLRVRERHFEIRSEILVVPESVAS